MSEYNEIMPSFTNRNRNIVNLAEAIPLRKPLKIAVEMSGMCNFSCVFCPNSLPTYKQAKRTGHMTLELWNKICSSLAEWEGSKIKTLNLFGQGESLINPLFTDMLRGGKPFQFN